MTDGVYIMLGDVVAWGGLTVIIFALFKDWAGQEWRCVWGGRKAMKRRCPKCWYDLSHSAGLRCSECGYQAKRERKLYRGRRRWRFVVLGFAIILGGYALRVAPAVNQRGWIAIVPTTAIIAMLPWMELCNPPAAVRAQGEFTAEQLLIAELYRTRAEPFQMWRWQRAVLANRCLVGDATRRFDSPEWRQVYGTILMALSQSEDSYIQRGFAASDWYAKAHNAVKVELHTREVWPVGVPVYVAVRLHRVVDWQTHIVTIGRAQSTTPRPPLAVFGPDVFWNPPEVDSGERMVCLGGFEAGRSPPLVTSITAYGANGSLQVGSQETTALFRVAGTIDDCISPLRFKPADDALMRCLSPQLKLSRTSQGFEGQLDLWSRSGVSSPEAKVLLDVTLAFHVEIMCNDEAVGTGRVWYAIEQLQEWANDRFRQGRSFHDLQWRADHMPLDSSAVNECAWSVRLRASPETALQNLDCDEYWDGEFVLPLDVSVGSWN